MPQMTVAHIRDAGGRTEVLFLESARIYVVGDDAPELIDRLKEAMSSRQPVDVVFGGPRGSVILAVR